MPGLPALNYPTKYMDSTLSMSFHLQIVKALEHLHSNLSVIHRGNQPVSVIPGVQLPEVVPHCLFAVLFPSRCETLQRPDQHSGPSENVRLRHQRPPGGLGGQNNGCRLQALHGSKWEVLIKQFCRNLPSDYSMTKTSDVQISSLIIQFPFFKILKPEQLYMELSSCSLLGTFKVSTHYNSLMPLLIL